MLLETGLYLLFCAQLPSAIPPALDIPPGISVHGSTVTVEPGAYHSAGKPVKVIAKAVVEIPSATTVFIENEPLKLSKDKPESWGKGTRLQAAKTRGINAYGAFVEGSLTIRKTPDGPPLVEGKDYLVAPDFGMVGLGPHSTVTANDTVYATYRCGRLRIDSLEVDNQGHVRFLRGQPRITTPHPPRLDAGCVRLLNVFRPYGAQSVSPEDLFPILDTPDQAKTHTTRGRIPKTLAKIESGQPVTIVCWGDSVTTGGNVSKGSMKYVEQFRRMLLDRFPFTAPINIINISYGGSNSMQWLRLPPYNDAYFAQHPEWPKDQIDFHRIEALKPDLVTIEFVNDAGLDTAGVERVYSDILNRLSKIGAEIILITPHFTSLKMMGNTSLREPDHRKYVAGLLAFADKHHVAVADASSRWAHLWREGIPYITLLDNSLNHPDDRGHRIFAEELVKCFDAP